MKKTFLLAGFLCYCCGLLLAIFGDLSSGTFSAPSVSMPFFSAEGGVDRWLFWKQVISTNLLVITINLLGGLSLGILSFATTLYNGYVLGYTLRYGLSHFGTAETLRYILPHSMEVLAIILSCALGFRLGVLVWQELSPRPRAPGIRRSELFAIAAAYLIVIIASFLEAYVTIPKT